MSEGKEIKLTVTRLAWGYEVHVSYEGGEDFATTRGPDLHLALRSAVPYIACAAEPDPFVAILRGFA